MAPVLTASFVGVRVSARAAAPARKARGSLVVRNGSINESNLRSKYPLRGSVYEVDLDCHMGTNSLGLIMKEGPDGRPVVDRIRPGGLAARKVKIGDVCVATSYTALVDDPERKWGRAEMGWFDTESESYVNAVNHMETNSAIMKLVLDGNYQPTGRGYKAPAAAESSFSSSSSNISSVSVSSSRGSSSGISPGEDVKAWAAKVAAQARNQQR